MADQHVGYPGSVNAAQASTWLPNVGSAQYSVEGLFDAQVITNNIGDRGVTVRPGTICGDGIMDVFETNNNLNFAAVATGSPDRWDMVVLRRTWNATPGASTSIYTIIQGGPNRSLPARNNTKGVITDQPIALCRIKAGSATVQEVVDLRVWAHNGGANAQDELVLNYLQEPGTEVHINGITWVRIQLTGQMTWIKVDQLNAVQLFGVAEALAGGATTDLVANMTGFLIQGGTKAQSTDASGYARITFPKPFPNGLLTVVVTNGDAAIDRAIGKTLVMSVAGSPPFDTGRKQDFVYGVQFGQWSGNINQAANQLHRVNWIAIGW